MICVLFLCLLANKFPLLGVQTLVLAPVNQKFSNMYTFSQNFFFLHCFSSLDFRLQSLFHSNFVKINKQFDFTLFDIFRMLEVFLDIKTLTRLGITIPKSLQTVSSQVNSFFVFVWLYESDFFYILKYTFVHPLADSFSVTNDSILKWIKR